MIVDVQRAYSGKYNQDLNKTLSQVVSTTKDVNNIRTKESKDINSVAKNELLNNFDPNTVVTQKERKFFIKMFPENSEQLEKHVLFNRNGRIASPSITKGSVFDGRI